MKITEATPRLGASTRRPGQQRSPIGPKTGTMPMPAQSIWMAERRMTHPEHTKVMEASTRCEELE